MTIEKLRQVRKRMASHFTFEKFYVTNYDTDIPGLSVHEKVGRKNGVPTNTAKVRYLYKGKAYKNLEDVLNAINRN